MVDVVGATTTAIAATSSVATVFTAGAGILGGANGRLPSLNVLSNYASYNYILGFSALSPTDINNPDSTYKAGKVPNYICKSANSDPSNRINTIYGKYDFFIDNLNFEALIAAPSKNATNVLTISFEIIEPYSLGVFLMSAQQAAIAAGFLNWRDAPFLLSIEFRGEKENGTMQKIPFSTRHIPIRLTTVEMRASEMGSKYTVQGYATSGQAMTTEFSELRTDATLSGKTVQEVLQSGKNSVQNIVNEKLKQYVKEGKQAIADQIVILFPKDIASAASSGSSATPTGSATVNPQVAGSSSSVFQKLGVAEKDLAQSPGDVNELGAAEMGYSHVRKGEPPPGEEKIVWNENTNSWTRGALTVDEKEGTLKFVQGTDIPTVIHQVMLTSMYADMALDPAKTDDAGFRPWWRIDTQVYYLPTEDNLPKTGTYPRIIVYRVVPYQAHSGKVAAANTKPKGYDVIKSQIVKRYDYIYTGKNSEVVKFDILFDMGFSNALVADSGNKSADTESQNKDADKKTPKSQQVNIDVVPVAEGANPEKRSGVYGTSKIKYDGKETSYAKAGGGKDSPATQAARMFHDAIVNPVDMINLNMEIQGDPFWIVNSGVGNYTSTPSGISKDLNKDGSVNWQNGEVDIIVNFRSPFDINQSTGLYDFKSPNNTDMSAATKESPVLGFTGLYCVTQITNSFKQGLFRQTLQGFRRPHQELQAAAKAAAALNSKTKNPNSNDGWGEG